MRIAIPISKPALRYAVEMCEMIPNYKVVVAVSDRSQASSAMDGLTDYVDCCQLVILRASSERFISFKNGSRINVVEATGSALGCRWNALIYSEDIDDKTISTIFLPCEARPYPTSS